MTESEKIIAPQLPPIDGGVSRRLSRRTVIVLTLALITAVCFVKALLQLNNSVVATVTLSSVYSESGKNPDGSPFDIMEILSDEVLNNAADSLGRGMSAEELRSHLSISDTMTNTSFSRLEQSILDGEYENTYFPTGYRVTYSILSDQIRDQGVWAQWRSLFESLFQPSKTEILNAVLQSYQKYYAQKYLNFDALFAVDWSALEDMDHFNRAEMLDDELERLLRFLRYEYAGSITKADSKGNMQLYDLITEISQGARSHIENYQAYVIQNGVTNDKAELLRQLAYMENLYEEEHTRKMNEYTVLREAIEIYDATTTKVVFIPALDGESEFYMNRTKVGMDYLVEKADTAKLQADAALYSAEYYSYLQTCFDDKKGQTQEKNTPENLFHAESLYERLKTEIHDLKADAKYLISESKQVNQEQLKVSSAYRNTGLVSVAMSAAKNFAFLLMAAYVVFYLAVLASKIKEKGGWR